MLLFPSIFFRQAAFDMLMVWFTTATKRGDTTNDIKEHLINALKLSGMALVVDEVFPKENKQSLDRSILENDNFIHVKDSKFQPDQIEQEHNEETPPSEDQQKTHLDQNVSSEAKNGNLGDREQTDGKPSYESKNHADTELSPETEKQVSLGSKSPSEFDEVFLYDTTQSEVKCQAARKSSFQAEHTENVSEKTEIVSLEDELSSEAKGWASVEENNEVKK